MIYQIFKNNGDDFELVQECELEADMLLELANFRASGSEYKAELNKGSSSMVLGV